jgi:hypothetical protein
MIGSVGRVARLIGYVPPSRGQALTSGLLAHGQTLWRSWLAPRRLSSMKS